MLPTSPKTRVRKTLVAAGAAVLVAAGLPAHTAQAATGHHTLAYYQTQYSNGAYVSPLPLRGIATDVEVAAFHLNADGSVHLNDDPPGDPKFDRMWADVAALRSSGIKVHALLGGAGRGSFANLHNDFTRFYGLLRDVLRTYHFDGVDLDIEETFSLADTERLIRQLRADFGSGFTVILTPVATDLAGTSSFSGGFSYRQLEQDLGGQISWYTGQFYCGWGSLRSTASYDAIVRNGFSPSRVLTGAVTNPANCSGYVEPSRLASTLRKLVAKYPGFGGAAGWEYFNGLPGPASWYATVRDAMGGS
ncbi:glycosyl hydrolase family 18 protein [Nonomuraea sediminis]|uniref:glycosyl hydrolase family 18 protein n=1 Tax=Nonomuraea sediminis TaxID=2835864 RepID=UPI001BDD3C7C|nr:glycosyl hydrolase family 18 protein [Nonomuraea sediminis]